MAVNTYAPDIARKLPIWTAIADVLDGSAAVKAKRELYLPRLPGQRVLTVGQHVVDMYANYLMRAVLLPFASPLVTRLLGMLFRKAPTVVVPSDDVEEQLDNVTLTAPAMIFEQFAKCVARSNLTFGSGAISVDYDERTGRPYQRLYPAGTIVRVWQQLLGATPVTTRVIVKECVEEPAPDDPFGLIAIEQYRVIELTQTGDAPMTDRYPFGYLQHQLYRQQVDAQGRPYGEWMPYGEPVVPTRRGERLWFVPLVPFNPFDLSWMVAKPPLQDLIELILAHYLNSADYEDLCHKIGGGTTLFGAGFTAQEQEQIVAAGPSVAIFASNPAATLQYVQAAERSMLNIAMERKEAQMAIAVGRLLMSQQKNVAESGASLELQFSGDDATLQQIAGTTAMALEEALKIHSWWAGAMDTPDEVPVSTQVDDAGETTETEMVHVEFSDSFVQMRMTAQDVLGWIQAQSLGGLSDADLFYNLQRGEALMPGQSFEAWQIARSAGGTMTESLMPQLRTAVTALRSAVAGGDPGQLASALAALDALLSHDGNAMPPPDESGAGD